MPKSKIPKELIVIAALVLLLAGCAAPATAPPTAVPPTATTAPTAIPPTATTAPTSTTAPTATTAATATSAATAEATATGVTPAMEMMMPNCGGGKCDEPGAAITQHLKGDPASGLKLFAANCAKCHGPQGKGGVVNEGSTDGTVPPLNPVDDPEAMHTDNPADFALTLDLFIEHGSTPDGPNPKLLMDSWGDKKLLTSQQIADLIAYIMSLNQ